MTARQQLIELHDVYDHKGSSDIFLEAMRDCIKHHIKNNQFFRHVFTHINYKLFNLFEQV